MKTITRDYRITGGYPSSFTEYFGDMRPCILDIEATGLAGYVLPRCSFLQNQE